MLRKAAFFFKPLPGTLSPMLAALFLQVTTETLLGEGKGLYNLTWPAGYTVRQFSSYDRASKKPGGDTWFANNDCGNYLRKDGDEFVLAEADGPGAIVRIWSANPAGNLKIYLDGKCMLDEDFAKLTSGKGSVPEAYAGVRGLGANLYYPFPYAKSMKVTTTKGGQYYHVHVRTFGKGVKVETFTKVVEPHPDATRAEEPLTEAFAGRLELTGPGIIERFELTQIKGDLREATITMTFDGEKTVWCPLGDFFGTAPGENKFKTLPMGTWYCNYPMPFAKSAVIEVKGAKVEGAVTHSQSKYVAPFRFYAWWRGSNHVKTRPMFDWTVLKGEGRGRYVGTALYVRNPVKAWWGEGDEKVFVDGEGFPSIFGTGTEDYFGYAWCDTAKFDHLYHSQSRCDGPGNKGHTAVNRFHILDDIPFEKSIQFDLEVWHWADCEMSYATVAYWYAEPGFKHDMKEAAKEDLEVLPAPQAKRVKGAIEGESMKVLESTGTAGVQDLDEGWSGESHLWWRDAKPGDVLRLEFDSPAAAKKIALAMTKAKDYGIVKLSLNGAALAESLDLYDPKVVPAGETTYDADVKQGANELRVEIVGTNAKADPKNYMFGLDYVRTDP